MADAITIKALQDASLDAKSLEEVVNGNEVKQVTTRKGETYPSVKKAINTMFENGGLPAEPFATKALMAASALVDGDYAMVTEDLVNNGLYVKTAGAWVKSDYDPLAHAIEYTDDEVAGLKSHLIDYTDSSVDAVDFSAHKLTGEQIYNKALEDTYQPFSAIWAEYNKPVWHIGNLVFIDAIGAEVDVVERELVFTIRLTKPNQKYYFPARDLPSGAKFIVDWGDGSVETPSSIVPNHTYSGEIGDEFTIRATGELNQFRHNSPNVTNDSPYCLVSIDKNTMPKTMTMFNLNTCTNLESVCDGAFSSFSGDSLNLILASNCPKLTLTSGMFNGLSNVVNIDNLIASYSFPISGDIPQGLLVPFINVESAEAIFYGATSEIPSDILRNMPKLKNARRMFRLAKSPESDLTEVFKYQQNLDNVSECFTFSTVQGDAFKIYQDIARGNPSEIDNCFDTVTNMTNIGQVPEEWK